MKFLLTQSVFLTLLMVQPVFGQHQGYHAVQNQDAFRKQFQSESSRIQTVSSEFVQEKILVALTEKITSQGKFWFKKNNKVRLEYLKPFAYLMVINGDKMLVRDAQKENHINVKSNKLFQQINRIMIDCIQGTILDSKDFSVKVFENEQTYLMELTPTGKALKEFFKTILLKVEKSNASVSSIEMNEPGGDQTTMTFINKRLNGPVSENLFNL